MAQKNVQRVSAGLLAGLALVGTVQAGANAWTQDYQNDTPGTSTPLPENLAQQGFKGDVNAKTGIAFGGLTAGDRPIDYGSLGSFWHNDAKTTLWCIDYGTAFAGVDGAETNVENNANSAITNYIITKYQGDNTPANQAAVAYAVHVLNDQFTTVWSASDGKNMTSGEMFQQLPKNPETAGIVQAGQAMIDDAKANVGPYVAEVTIGDDYSVTSSLKSAAGNDITGFTAKYTLTGAGSFDVNGDGVFNDGDTQEVTLKTGDKIPNIVRSDDKGGDVNIKMSVTDLPGGEIKVWDGGGVSQTVMASGNASDAVDATDSANVAPASPVETPNPKTYTPKVTTQTSHNWATPGTKISDKISVTGNADNQKLTVTSVLWHSDTKPTESDTVPADAQKVGEVTTDVTGNGTFTTPEITVTDGGYYVWTESIPETPIAGATDGSKTEAWQGKYGVSTEITPVGDVSTNASEDVELGNAIHDTATVEGVVPEGAYLTFDLYKISDDAVSDADVDKGDFSAKFDEKPVWSSTENVPVNGAGEYKSAEFTPTEAGTYSYRETLHDKDGNVLKVGKAGEGKESVIVKETPKPTETPQPSETPSTPVETPSTPAETPQPSTPAKTTTPAPVVQQDTPSTPAPQVVTQGTANTGGSVDANNNAGLFAGISALIAGAGVAFGLTRRNRKA